MRNLLCARCRIGGMLLVMAGASSGYAAGETIGYSSPFMFSQFQVILQDQTVAAAEAAGLKALEPTNADGDSGKQITDVRNLIGAGAKGLIVVANDSKAIIPALDYAVSQNVPVVSIDIGPDGGSLYAIVRANNIGMGWIACQDMAKAIGDSGKVLSLQGAATSINGRERSEGFRDCITKEHPNIELIERPTDWDATKQAAALQTVLAANPDLKGIFQQSDYALSPTLNVLKQAGRDAKVGEAGAHLQYQHRRQPTGTGAYPQRRSRRRHLAAARPLCKIRRSVPARRACRQGAGARQDRSRQRGRRVQRQQDGSASGRFGDQGECRRCSVVGEPGEVSSIRHGSE